MGNINTVMVRTITFYKLLFNQPSSRGVMIYRLLPLVMIGLMEYKFMTPLTSSDEERELAELFETLLAELKDEIQNNYDTLKPLFEVAPAIDRTVPTGQTGDGKTIQKITVDQGVDMPVSVAGSVPDSARMGPFHSWKD